MVLDVITKSYKNNQFLLVFFTAYFLILAFYFQTQMLLSSDVACLLNEANQMLAGGKYGADFFETNPPMILYLYFPVCLFAKITSINIILLLRLYVFLLALISAGINLYLLKKIIKPDDKILLNILYYVMLIVMLFLPVNEFGQREHLLLILMLPYLFSAVLELQGKSISKSLAFVIGVMAGLGFALKPYFLVTVCLIELYFIFLNRKIFAWVRIESIVIASILILYLCSVFFFQPEYINVILPLVSHYYFGWMADTWINLLSNPAVTFCWLTIIFYYLVYKKDRYHILNTVLFLAMLGMMVAFIIPKTPWYYHVLPAMSLAMLLIANCVVQLYSEYLEKNSKKILLFICLSLFIFSLPIYLVSFRYYQYLNLALSTDTANKLKNFINAHPGEHSIYCFTTVGTQDCFPLNYMTDSSYGGRLPFFWWYRGLNIAESSPSSSINKIQVAQEKKLLIDNVAEDLNRYKAKWIIVNYYNFGFGGTILVDFIDHNEKFRDAWKQYRHVMTISQYWIYERKTG